jgi:hypothetical protein
MTLLDQVTKAMATLRVHSVGVEAELQQQIAGVLDDVGIRYGREVTIGPRSRVDFLVEGGVVIEVKMGKPNSSQVIHQLTRYAEFEAVQALVLVVERNVYWLPESIAEKPVRYVSLSRNWGVAL